MNQLNVATRGKRADYERVTKNLKLLLEEGINLTTTIIIRDDTVHTLEETLNYLFHKLGVENINISPAFDMNYSDNLKTSPISLQKMKRIKDKFSSTAIRFLEPEGEAIRDKFGNVICKSHYFDITIGADYGVYPCCAVSYLEKYKIMDLSKYKSFKEAWGSDERQNWVENTKINCNSCWFSPINKMLKDILDV